MSETIGTGRLNWPRGERITDRYGLVSLYDRRWSVMLDRDDVESFDGRRGRLVATVVETRESSHIGDLFRGIAASTPEVGDRLVLGEGTVFIEPIRDNDKTIAGYGIGLRPDDDERGHDWLDPEVLYRIHDQTVLLRFEEDDE